MHVLLMYKNATVLLESFRDGSGMGPLGICPCISEIKLKMWMRGTRWVTAKSVRFLMGITLNPNEEHRTPLSWLVRLQEKVFLLNVVLERGFLNLNSIMLTRQKKIFGSRSNLRVTEELGSYEEKFDKIELLDYLLKFYYRHILERNKKCILKVGLSCC